MKELYISSAELFEDFTFQFWMNYLFYVVIYLALVLVIFKIIDNVENRKRDARLLKHSKEIDASNKTINNSLKLDTRKEQNTHQKIYDTIETEKVKRVQLNFDSAVKALDELFIEYHKQEKVDEGKIDYKTIPKQIERPKEILLPPKKDTTTEILPTVKKEKGQITTDILVVNYQTNVPDSIDDYPILRIPKKGCIVRTHRFGTTKRRGFKEESFQRSIQKYFVTSFIVTGEVRLNTGKETRPFEPDIAIIDKNQKNIRIDIEIDEPYAGITRQPTHCFGEDLMRDTYFIDRGWIVIRFSEYQVHTQEYECLKFIAFLIKSIDQNYNIPNDLDSTINLKSEKLWDVVQAQKWEKAKYREQYLNHEFEALPEEQETDERDFSEQEKKEEMLVQPTLRGLKDNGKNIGYNKTNAHPRDKRISFYPENHLYIIDNKPVCSVSTIISKFFPEFDNEYWASRKAPEFGMNPQDVVQMWKAKGQKAAQEGTYLHEQIENFLLKQQYQRTAEFYLFEQFIEDHKNVEPYRTEWRIFDEDYNIAGTIDFISRNGYGFEIFDWKRSKKVVNSNTGSPIVANPWQSGIGVLSDIPDTSYNRYCLQQSLYRYILESKYDLEISKMFLIILSPDYERYYKVETPYWKDRIINILKTL